MDHCADHSGACERINHLCAEYAGLAARMNRHEANGDNGHPQRHELRTLTEDVSTLTSQVKEVCEAVTSMKNEKQAGLAMRNFWGPIIVGLVMTAGNIALALSNLGK